MSNIESTKSAASLDAAAAAASSAPSAAPRNLPESDAVVRFQNELARCTSNNPPASSKDESFADLFRFGKQTGSQSAAVPDDMPPLQRFDGGKADALAPGRNVPSQENGAGTVPMTSEDLAHLQELIQKQGSASGAAAPEERPAGQADGKGFMPMTSEDLARLQELAQKRETAARDVLTPGQSAQHSADDARLAPLSSEELARIAALASGEAAPARAGDAAGIFPSSSVPQAASGGAASNEALQALVSRILVSSPDAGPAAVRLTLAGQLLGGTEVTLMRGADGALAVKLAAGDPAAFQTLVAGRDDLARLLSAGERMPVSIQIESEQDAQDDEHDRRSRHEDASRE